MGEHREHNMTTRDDPREALEVERAELVAKNEAATSWGAAVGIRHERIKEIDRELALTAPAPKGEPAAWADSQGLERPIDAEAMKILRQNPTTEAYWSRFTIPLYTSPPPAVGWDEAIGAAAAAAEADESTSHFAISARVRIARRIRALRREAPAPEGVAKIGGIALCGHGVMAAMCEKCNRPDAGGDVREQIAALAHRFWSIHPSRLDDIGLTREQFYAQEMTALFTALSNPPAAAGNDCNAEAEFPSWDAEDEAYELGKRYGYESAVQDFDIATGGDGEFKGSTIPGETIDVETMKRRVIGRFAANESAEARLRIEPTMDIYSKPGTKVRFTGQGGYESQNSYAREYLTVGEVYTVSRTDVGGWHTDVTLSEFPDHQFNSVLFTALSAGGDEAKKSDGAIYAEVSKRGTPPEDRAEIERVIDKALQDHAICGALERRPSDPTADQREIVARLRKLIATATLLYQNAVGCAANHYSVDFEQQGLPGWLADCERDIRAASAALDGGR